MIAKALLISGVFLLGSCAQLPKITPISTTGAVATRIDAGLNHWPHPGDAAIRRPFFATIHIGAHRITASGILEINGPRDIRVTAATELGAILFDGRFNWAGATVLRKAAEIDADSVEKILADFAAALEIPDSLEGIGVVEGSGGNRIDIRRTLGDKVQYVWSFEADSGRLRVSDIDFPYGFLGTPDTLHVEYRSYNARGWPVEIYFARKSQSLEVWLSFTGDNVVQTPAPPNAQ